MLHKNPSRFSVFFGEVPMSCNPATLSSITLPSVVVLPRDANSARWITQSIYRKSINTLLAYRDKFKSVMYIASFAPDVSSRTTASMRVSHFPPHRHTHFVLSRRSETAEPSQLPMLVQYALFCSPRRSKRTPNGRDQRY